jgi:hypothetical protein
MTITFAHAMTRSSHADSLDHLRTRLPGQVKDWIAEPTDRIYDEKTIFHYINGAGEVYKAYNLHRCLSRRYRNPSGPVIILDIFDMGSSQDAYGVFTHDTDGKVIKIGQDARLRPGWLSFWKHRFFVSIYMEEESAAAEKAVLALGRQVAAGITLAGDRPRLLRQLPSRGLVSDHIRFLHHPIILNYHFYLSDQNILNLSPETDAVLASYRQSNKKARLLLVYYADPETAKKSLTGFLKHYLPDADQTGTARLENGKWASARLKGHLLAAVLEADSRPLTKELLKPF